MALERERNRDLVAPGKGQDAQGVDDYRALLALTEKYRQNGMTAEQAKRDFDLSVRARNPEQPRISVDSLQAVGGGGFSSNPNSDYPRRTVALTEQMLQVLKQIADKGGQGGVID